MKNSQLLSNTSKRNQVCLFLTKVDTDLGRTTVALVQQEGGNVVNVPTYEVVDDVLTEYYLSTTARLAWLYWENKLYLSNLDLPLKRLEGKVISEVNTTDSVNAETFTKGKVGYREVKAKYLCNSDSHLMLGNLVVNDTQEPLMVTWSDLYDPDNFEQSSSTEGGYFIFPASDKEIMGLVYNRGYTVILTRGGVWLARYVGYSSGIFEFNNLSNSVGCNHHFSAIAAKDAVFFIGKDNFYVVDGNSISPIGTEIWKAFKEMLKTFDEDVIAFLDEDIDCVYWQFTAGGGGGTVDGARYELLYNYKEQKWALRQSEGIVDTWRSESSVVTPITAEELPVPASYYATQTYPRKCSDFVRTFSYTRLFLAETKLYQLSDSTKDGLDGAGRNFSIETKDFSFLTGDTRVSVLAVRLICSHNKMLGTAASGNGASLKASLGYRNNLGSSLTWTPEVSVASWLHAEEEIIFHFRKYFVSGKFFRLRITGKEVSDSFMNSLSACQFTVDVPKNLNSVTI